jgi:hypothetical protein
LKPGTSPGVAMIIPISASSSGAGLAGARGRVGTAPTFKDTAIDFDAQPLYGYWTVTTTAVVCCMPPELPVTVTV